MTGIVTVTPNPGIDLTLTVPQLTLNQVLRATHTRSDMGGKGFNVSRALQALGTPSVTMGFIGGFTGQRMAAGLQQIGLETDFVEIAGETRTNVVVTNETASEHLKANEPGPEVTPGEIAAFFDRVSDRVRAGDTWVLSGSLPPGVPADFYAQLIESIQQVGARAVVDTSGEPLRQACHARPFMVKPNDIEAEQVTGCPIESEEDARRAASDILGYGIKIVALSLGAEGLILATGDETLHARPPHIQARNTVGAGDALVAGLVWALEQHLPLCDVARWGVAAGSVSAAREGVTFGTAGEVRQMLEKVRVS